jgi:hypothetical protein
VTVPKKPQRPQQLGHLPDKLYEALAALKQAHISAPEPEPVEGWNTAINALFIAAANSSSKKPLTRPTVAFAIQRFEIALAEAFKERGDELNPVAYQAWEAAAVALGRAGELAGPV